MLSWLNVHDRCVAIFAVCSIMTTLTVVCFCLLAAHRFVSSLMNWAGPKHPAKSSTPAVCYLSHHKPVVPVAVNASGHGCLSSTTAAPLKADGSTSISISWIVLVSASIPALECTSTQCLHRRTPISLPTVEADLKCQQSTIMQLTMRQTKRPSRSGVHNCRDSQAVHPTFSV